MAEETAFLSLRSGQALALAVTKRLISCMACRALQ